MMVVLAAAQVARRWGCGRPRSAPDVHGDWRRAALAGPGFAGGIDHAAAMLLDKIAHGLTVISQGSDGGSLIIVHESAIAFYIGTEDRGEFTPKNLFCHNDIPAFRISRTRTHNVNYSKEFKN